MTVTYGQLLKTVLIYAAAFIGIVWLLGLLARLGAARRGERQYHPFTGADIPTLPPDTSFKRRLWDYVRLELLFLLSVPAVFCLIACGPLRLLYSVGNGVVHAFMKCFTKPDRKGKGVNPEH